MIHAFKPDPVTNRQEAWRFFDFVQHHPESLHMVTWVKSPWGIPADYRHMEGSSVNTYKLVNDEGVAHLVKFSWVPKQGVKNLTSPQAAEIQARDVGHATKDLHDAIERGDYPEWEFCAQIMSDDEHPELDFDPLDDTKRWPEDKFPLLPVGRMVLNRNPDNFFAEAEQSAFGTGVLVDGIDFSDDKMLQGRTLSYSDTQRYRVGPNYLQLPVNAPKSGARTNQRDGQMAYLVDGAGENKHVNYEPSSMGGLHEAPKRQRDYHQLVEGRLGRYQYSRTQDDYKQAGERYRTFEDWEREDLDQQPRRGHEGLSGAHRAAHGVALLALRRGLRPPRGRGSRNRLAEGIETAAARGQAGSASEAQRRDLHQRRTGAAHRSAIRPSEEAGNADATSAATREVS